MYVHPPHCRAIHDQAQYLFFFRRCMHLLNSAFESVGEHCPALLHLYLDGCYTLRDDDLLKVSHDNEIKRYIKAQLYIPGH